MMACLMLLADVQWTLTPRTGEGDRSPGRFLSSLGAKLQLRARSVAHEFSHRPALSHPGKEGTGPGNMIS
jgi:hypothetical protein